jgi:large subunit ribosomal protein L29
MKATELHEMGDEQLAITLKETQTDYFRLKIQAQTERLDAPSELRRHRRLIARIKTVQRQREIAKEAKEATAAAK